MATRAQRQAYRRRSNVCCRGISGPQFRATGCLLLAEGVEEVRTLGIFDTMFQITGFRRINIAARTARTNNSFAKLDGPDFFNSLSQQRTFRIVLQLAW